MAHIVSDTIGSADQQRLPVLACLDVAYCADASGVACVLCEGWQSAEAREVISHRHGQKPASYVPGAFYKRELPLLLDVLQAVHAPIDAVVIDGYVWLSLADRPGLGARLYWALKETVPVIGVAKTPFTNDRWSVPVMRGRSTKPLLVTAAGIASGIAAEAVRTMHGDHRIPTMLRCADSASKLALRQQPGGDSENIG